MLELFFSTLLLIAKADMLNSPPPPAPMVGPSLMETIRILKQGDRLPITLGIYEPRAVIIKENGEYALKKLELDKVAESKTADAGLKKGHYVPEMSWKNLHPGKKIISNRDLDQFIQLLQKSWLKEYGPKK